MDVKNNKKNKMMNSIIKSSITYTKPNKKNKGKQTSTYSRGWAMIRWLPKWLGGRFGVGPQKFGTLTKRSAREGKRPADHLVMSRGLATMWQWHCMPNDSVITSAVSSYSRNFYPSLHDFIRIQFQNSFCSNSLLFIPILDWSCPCYMFYMCHHIPCEIPGMPLF